MSDGPFSGLLSGPVGKRERHPTFKFERKSRVTHKKGKFSITSMMENEDGNEEEYIETFNTATVVDRTYDKKTKKNYYKLWLQSPTTGENFYSWFPESDLKHAP